MNLCASSRLRAFVASLRAPPCRPVPVVQILLSERSERTFVPLPVFVSLWRKILCASPCLPVSVVQKPKGAQVSVCGVY
jgi:hypothetical protein